MIAAGVKAPHIKIPMITCHNKDVSLDVLALPTQQTPQQAFVWRDPRLFHQSAHQVSRELFMQTDQAIGVSGPVQRLEPLQISVPAAEPRFAILPLRRGRQFQLWVFEDLQRKPGLPG